MVSKWTKFEFSEFFNEYYYFLDDWLCFDDDNVSPCKTEDIQKLKGGGNLKVFL